MDKFEALKNYKELLDSGIITQEEFDAKKKELLGAPEEAVNRKEAELGGQEVYLETINDHEDAVEEISFETTTEGEIPIDVATEEELPVEMVSAEAPYPSKKKFYTQKWFWIVIAAVLVLGIVFGNGSDDKKAIDDNTAAVEEQTQEESTYEDNTYEDYSSDEASTGSSSITISDDILVDTLNSASDTWQGTWKIAGDRHFAFYPEGDLAEAFTFLGNYYMQTGEIPAEIEDSFNYMCESIKSLSKTMSETAGEPCALSIVNPSNTDNVLITYMNGESLYNAFEQ